MKPRYIVLLSACLLLGVLAIGQASTSADQTFVTTVGQVGMFEVKSGELAESKSSNADVKKFGHHMIEDHTRLGDELKKLAASNGFTFPADMGPANRKALDGLAAKKGKAFDQAYASVMVSGHEGAVQLFENTAKTAQDPELKAWAAATLPVIKDHLKMARELAEKVK